MKEKISYLKESEQNTCSFPVDKERLPVASLLAMTLRKACHRERSAAIVFLNRVQ
jgi:hypothetical protein